jgi:hypothetical protein
MPQYNSALPQLNKSREESRLLPSTSDSLLLVIKYLAALLTHKVCEVTISHCGYFVTTFKALADNSQELAASHERMANEAPQKVAPAGK